MNPLITLIALSYNGGRRIISTLESFRLQKYENKELLVVDDCSCDGGESRKLISKWIELHKKEFRRVSFIQNEVNQGVVASLYKAGSFSEGEIIIPNGQGDLLFDENTLSDMAIEIQSQREKGALDPYFWLVHYKAFSMLSGRFVEINLYKDLTAHHFLFKKHPATSLRRNLRRWDIGGVGVVYHSRFFKTTPFPLSGAPRNWEDGPLFLWALIEGKLVGSLPLTIRLYEIGVGISWSHKKGSMRSQFIKKIDLLLGKSRMESIIDSEVFYQWLSNLVPCSHDMQQIRQKYLDDIKFRSKLNSRLGSVCALPWLAFFCFKKIINKAYLAIRFIRNKSYCFREGRKRTRMDITKPYYRAILDKDNYL